MWSRFYVVFSVTQIIVQKLVPFEKWYQEAIKISGISLNVSYRVHMLLPRVYSVSYFSSSVYIYIYSSNVCATEAPCTAPQSTVGSTATLARAAASSPVPVPDPRGQRARGFKSGLGSGRRHFLPMTAWNCYQMEG